MTSWEVIKCVYISSYFHVHVEPEPSSKQPVKSGRETSAPAAAPIVISSIVSFYVYRCHVHLWPVRALLSQEAPGWRVWIQSTAWVAGCRANAAEFTPLGAYWEERRSTYWCNTVIHWQIQWSIHCVEWMVKSTVCNSWTLLERNGGIKRVHFRLQR